MYISVTCGDFDSARIKALFHTCPAPQKRSAETLKCFLLCISSVSGQVLTNKQETHSTALFAVWYSVVLRIIIVSKITSMFQRHHIVVTLGQQLPNVNKLQDFYLSTPECAKIKKYYQTEFRDSLKILVNMGKDECTTLNTSLSEKRSQRDML